MTQKHNHMKRFIRMLIYYDTDTQSHKRFKRTLIYYDTDTQSHKRFERTLIYYDTDTQSANCVIINKSVL